MAAIAPNLTVLVGELVGARLIAHAGSLLNLAKHPASTVQILGAEKALFRALKTRQDTPKYGLIYHASMVGQAAPKNKGKLLFLLPKVIKLLQAKCPVCSPPRPPSPFVTMPWPRVTPKARSSSPLRHELSWRNAHENSSCVKQSLAEPGSLFAYWLKIELCVIMIMRTE